MLDEVIASRTATQEDSRRLARNLQRIARVVVIPAASIMLLGLIAFGISDGLHGELLRQAVVPVRSIFSGEVLSPLGAMSAGLLALALLPVVSVIYILVDSLLHRRWTDVAAAAAVTAVLVLAILLGQA
jgi:uncharacterized membrane protein